MDLNTAPRGELIRLIYELADKVELLEGEIARLKDQLHQRGTGKDNDAQIPLTIKPNKKKKKAKKRKQREEAFIRKTETPDKQVFHTEKMCPDCHKKLGKPVVSYARQIIDIPVTPYTVTEHVVFKRWCYRCKKCVQPAVNLKGQVLGKGRIGINLASAIAAMRDRLRLPVRVIQTYLMLFHHLSLSQGEIVSLLHTTASRGRPAYERLLAEIRNSDAVYADETGGREDGRNGYFWSFSTDRVHFLMYRKSRAAKIVEEIVGEESEKFKGVLSTDFYAAYNTYCGFHQRCWVHLMRDIHELKEKYKKHPPLNIWAKRVKQIITEAKAYSGPDPGLPIGLQAEERMRIQRNFEERLKKICAPYLKKDYPMSTLCGRIITFMPELFTFIRCPEINPDNNKAERQIRHTVIARKIQGGTRSARGSETKTILTSLFDTWILQKKNPLEQCRLLLATC